MEPIGGGVPRGRGRRTSTVLAWLLGLVAAGLIAGALWLSASGPGEQSGLFGVVTMGLVTVGFSTVGALVASRHPSNLIGWIFCAVGLISAANGFAEAYARRGFVVAPGSLAGGALAVWAQNWLWIPLIGVTATFSLLLFPDGRLPSRRWRPIVWTSTAAIAATTFGFFAGPLEDELTESIATYTNPTGLSGTAGRAAEVLGLIGFGLLLGSALASIVSLVARFRHSSQMQRQQIKWFAFGGSVLGLTVVVGSALWQVSPVARLLVPCQSAAGSGERRYRHPQVPPLRHRPDHQSHARLRSPDCCSRTRISWRCHPASAAVAPVHWDFRPRGGRLNSRRRRSLQAGARPCSGVHRPVFLPSQVRRCADLGGVLRSSPGGDRARKAVSGAPRGGAEDDATGTSVAMATPAGKGPSSG